MIPYQLQLRDLEKGLIKEYNNLNKSKKRPRSLKSTHEKKAKTHEIILEYKTILSKLEFKLPFEEWNKEIETYKKLKLIFNKSNIILNETEILPLAPFKAAVKAIIFCRRLSRNLITMPAIDIKLGTSLIVTYDGCPDNLSTFLDAVSLFKDTVNTEFAAATADQRAAANETLFKFIKTRLTGTARLAITGAVTIEEILQNLKEKCSSKVNSDGIRAKL